MPVTPLPITGGFYESSVLPLSAQTCVNAYPHIAQGGALVQEALFDTPGLTQLDTSGASVAEKNRGARTFEGRPYFVNGNGLYCLTDSNTLSSLGTIEGSKRVSLSDNGTQLMILVPGGNGYIFEDGSLSQITDSDFTANGKPQYVVFIDGYFCCVTDEGKFIISALNNGNEWNALDFGSAESNPDGVVVPYVLRNQLYIAGERTIEGFTNTGGAEFPFTRSGLFIDKGVVAPLSVQNTNSAVIFIGAGEREAPSVWLHSGNYPEKVSTDAVDRLLKQLTSEELSAAHAWSYGAEGHFFVGFVLPETTIVYDLSTGRWHERKSRVDVGGSVIELQTYRVSSLIQTDGQVYVADLLDGRVGILDDTAYDEYGERIFRQFATQPFQNNMQPFTVPRLELTIESGVGNADEEEPMIRMEISRDGGKTWSNERPRKMGRVGEYNRRAVWRRNGRTERFDVYRFTTTAPVKFAALQLTAQIEGMANAA